MKPARTAPPSCSHRGATSSFTHFTQLVILIANQAGMAVALITQHADDGTGHCRRCTIGAQAGRHTWPCQTYMAAQQATELSHDVTRLGSN
jgi:hypothetical protein